MKTVFAFMLMTGAASATCITLPPRNPVAELDTYFACVEAERHRTKVNDFIKRYEQEQIVPQYRPREIR